MIRVNLQPRVVVEAKEGFQLPIWAPVLLGLIMLVGCGGGYWYFNFTITSMKAQLKSLTNKLEDFQYVLKDYKTASEEHDYLKSKRDFVQNISTNQHRWIDFLEMLKAKTPKDVWFDKLTVDRNGSFKVDGGTYSYDSIANFMYRLTQFPQLKSVNLDAAQSKTQGSAQAGSIADSMTKMFKISAACKLDPNEKDAPKPGARPAPAAGGKKTEESAK